MLLRIGCWNSYLLSQALRAVQESRKTSKDWKSVNTWHVEKPGCKNSSVIPCYQAFIKSKPVKRLHQYWKKGFKEMLLFFLSEEQMFLRLAIEMKLSSHTCPRLSLTYSASSVLGLEPHMHLSWICWIFCPNLLEWFLGCIFSFYKNNYLQILIWSRIPGLTVITLASASPVQLKPFYLDLFLMDKCSPSLQLRHENLVTLCRWPVGFTWPNFLRGKEKGLVTMYLQLVRGDAWVKWLPHLCFTIVGCKKMVE